MSLLDAYRTTKDLYSRLERNTYIEAPAALRSIKRSLESVLTDCGLLEHEYVCTMCGEEMWLGEFIPIEVVECAECGSDMEKFRTRSVSDE